MSDSVIHNMGLMGDFFIIIILLLFLPIAIARICRILLSDYSFLEELSPPETRENPMAEAIDDTKKIISYTEEIKKIKNKWIKRHDETLSSYMEERNNN